MSDMDNKTIIQWLRDNSAGIYRPSREAADKLDTAIRLLALWLEWARAHGHEQHAGGIARETERLLKQ